MQTDRDGNIVRLDIKVMPAERPQMVKTDPWIIIDHLGVTIGVVKGRQIAQHIQHIFEKADDVEDRVATAEGLKAEAEGLAEEAREHFNELQGKFDVMKKELVETKEKLKAMKAEAAQKVESVQGYDEI